MNTTTSLILKHQLTQAFRVPGWLIIGLTQPVLYILLFGPLVERFAAPFGFDPWLVFVPGVLVMLAMFGGMNSGFGVVAELRAGVIERERVTPTARISLLMGRVYRDGIVVLVQAAIVMVLGSMMGMRPHWFGVLLTLLLVAVLTVGIAAISAALGLATRNESSVSAVSNGMNLPLMLLAGILLPMEFAPGWLEFLSRLNPLTYTVDAARALTAGDFLSTDALVGSAVTLGLTALLVTIAARRFSRENA